MRYPDWFPDDHPDDPRTYVPNIEFYIQMYATLHVHSVIDSITLTSKVTKYGKTMKQPTKHGQQKSDYKRFAYSVASR